MTFAFRCSIFFVQKEDTAESLGRDAVYICVYVCLAPFVCSDLRYISATKVERLTIYPGADSSSIFNNLLLSVSPAWQNV
jgi:hypothetical protein